jgi:lysozyme
MKVSEKGINLLHQFEGCELEAYLCPAKIWTIGYGNTFYLDGTPVKEGDVITKEQAEELFKNILVNFENCVLKSLGKTKISQNKFDALVSLAYNIGCGNFRKSTVIKRTIANPNDPSIANAFLMWNKIKGKVSRGLTRRREAEAQLFFTVDDE